MGPKAGAAGWGDKKHNRVRTYGLVYLFIIYLLSSDNKYGILNCYIVVHIYCPINK